VPCEEDGVTSELADQLADLAITVATEAGRIAKAGRDGAVLVATKSSDTDFVTSMDRQVEAFIVDSLSRARPADGFVLEEGENRPSLSAITWCVDPIDGTTNYLRKLPHYSVSIAALAQGVCIAGAINDPVTQETFSAKASSQAAMMGTENLQASRASNLRQALIATGFGYRQLLRERQAITVRAVLPEVSDLRRLGSAALALAWVAAGRLDAFWEIGLSQWDYAAGAFIARQAGAHVGRWMIDDSEDQLLIASAPDLFDDLFGLIRASDPRIGKRID
jgi:myo-inositol-1(or 4)-monophosphatase